MLIRSQNKKNLINLTQATNIAIISREGRFKIMAYYQVEDGYDCIGEYSTEAKAIKVLDKIQERYHDIEMSKIPEYDKGWVPFIFQMPSDEEVEE